MRYLIKRTLDPAGMEEGRIACYPWGGDYRPDTRFRAGWGDECLRVLMRCEETRTRATVTERNGNVWCDSCMEFFIAPGRSVAEGYFNFEMNSLGTLLLHFGLTPAQRQEVDWPMEDFRLRAERKEDRWTLDLTVPFRLLSRFVPSFSPVPGAALRGNFYKCGDETETPHFGCHFPIDAAAVTEPDFHRPEYFGALVLA